MQIGTIVCLVQFLILSSDSMQFTSNGSYGPTLHPQKSMKKPWITITFCGINLHMLEYYSPKALVISRCSNANRKSLKIGFVPVMFNQTLEKLYFLKVLISYINH